MGRSPPQPQAQFVSRVWTSCSFSVKVALGLAHRVADSGVDFDAGLHQFRFELIRRIGRQLLSISETELESAIVSPSTSANSSSTPIVGASLGLKDSFCMKSESAFEFSTYLPTTIPHRILTIKTQLWYWLSFFWFFRSHQVNAVSAITRAPTASASSSMSNIGECKPGPPI